MASGSCICNHPHKVVCFPTVYPTLQSRANMFHNYWSCVYIYQPHLFIQTPIFNVWNRSVNLTHHQHGAAHLSDHEDPLISFKQCNTTPSVSWGPHGARWRRWLTMMIAYTEQLQYLCCRRYPLCTVVFNKGNTRPPDIPTVNIIQ